MQANHFPGTWQLGRKDKLYTNIARAKRMRGSFFDVIPKFYILPRDRQDVQRHALAHPDQLYIQKVIQHSLHTVWILHVKARCFIQQWSLCCQHETDIKQCQSTALLPGGASKLMLTHFHYCDSYCLAVLANVANAAQKLSVWLSCCCAIAR